MTTQRIDFEATKARLKQFLQSDPKFKDFNFEASGISTLLNILAYNAHYLGTYAHFLNNESSMDSAQLPQSVYSKARGLGYVPKGRRASRVEVVVRQTVDEFPERGFTTLHRFKDISGTSSRTSDTRFFSNPDDVHLYHKETTPDGKFVFESKPTVLLEGQVRTWRFQVVPSVQYQRFVIKDKTLDIDSLRVFVKTSESDSGEVYVHAQDVFRTTRESRVFYVTTTHDGYYEIFFGNGVFGHQPEADRLISCEYLSTSGEMGNGCSKFTLAGFEIIPSETSNSGSNGESLESIKFNAINHFRSQNRLFEVEDYHSAILSRFRNVQAINVWGGEDHFQKSYNKVFVSVKPYFANALSSSAKDDIRDHLLKRNKRLGADIVFMDAEFIDCMVDVVLKVKLDKTSAGIQEVEAAAIKAVEDYNQGYLNVFDNHLSDVALNQKIVESHRAIVSSYTRKQLVKSVDMDIASSSNVMVHFGNEILPGSVQATLVQGLYKFSITDNAGTIIAKAETPKGVVQYSIGTIDYKTGLIIFKRPLKGYRGIQKVSFTVTPRNPDIASTLNNIVSISRVRVVHE